MDMSLEDLMDLTVTSMSKRVQSLQDTAAAIYVVTDEDIRRSGATSIPEALRMVPGLMVGRNTSGAWSVSSRGRGFNPTFENKLLVLIDGRSIYTPVFSGVFWESIDIVMEDIDRIEVIRGPGNSVWGANAVNGIINIITKSSADTQGLMGSAIYGTEELGTGAVRYGGTYGEDNTYRVYGKYRHIDGFDSIDEENLYDDLYTSSTGFRTDLNPDQDTRLTLQGDVSRGRYKSTLVYPDMTTDTIKHDDLRSDMTSANLQGRYTRDFSATSNVSLQSYYSHDAREAAVYNVYADTYDLDFQHQFSPLENNIAQWGLGYRLVTTRNDYDPEAISFTNSHRSDNLYSAFLQDEITFGGGAWVLTLGSKFEHNDQTGWEVLPSARLLWHANEENSLWTAISRSVRTPAIAESDVTYHKEITNVMYPNPYGSPPYISMPLRTSITGSDDVGAESAVVLEFGHRFTPSKKFYVDSSLYYAKSNHLLSSSIDSLPYLSMAPSIHLQLDTHTGNDESGEVYGLETAVTWIPLEWWKLQGWYSYCEEKYEYEGDGIDIFETQYGHISPRHQFYFRSAMDLPYDTEFDIMGRYVSELTALHIPDYATLDLRLGWRPEKNVEISLVGQNLIEPRHLESATDIVYSNPAAVSRSAFLKLRVDF